MGLGLGALFVVFKALLDFVPQVFTDDGRVLAWVGFVLVGDSSNVNGIAQDSVQVASAEGFVATNLTHLRSKIAIVTLTCIRLYIDTPWRWSCPSYAPMLRDLLVQMPTSGALSSVSRDCTYNIVSCRRLPIEGRNR